MVKNGQKGPHFRCNDFCNEYVYIRRVCHNCAAQKLPVYERNRTCGGLSYRYNKCNLYNRCAPCPDFWRSPNFNDTTTFPVAVYILVIERFVNQNGVNLVLEFENHLKTVYKICITYIIRHLDFVSKLLIDATFVSNNILQPYPIFQPHHGRWYL